MNIFDFDSFGDPKPLAEFPAQSGHVAARRLAIAYAKENPNSSGYVTVKSEETGGWRFYQIKNGKAYVSSAIECLPKSFR